MLVKLWAVRGRLCEQYGHGLAFTDVCFAAGVDYDVVQAIG